MGFSPERALLDNLGEKRSIGKVFAKRGYSAVRILVLALAGLTGTTDR